MKTILLCVALGALTGCSAPAPMYRAPRPDELRPGDIPPSPGPFIESSVPQGVQAPIAYQPPPVPARLPYMLPVAPPPQPYVMPIQRQTVCNTQRIGNQLQTVCY